ncbi:MAG: hypothetical protein ABI810_06765 [Sphingomonas bacterium]
MVGGTQVGHYVEPRSARHRVETVDGVEQIRIPVRRNWFVIIFLPIWLAGWTAGGIAALAQVMRNFEPFLLIWLCFWAVAFVAVCSTLALQIWSAEMIAVQGGDIIVRSGAKPIMRSWRYRGSVIRNLRSAAPAVAPFGMRYMQTPFWIRPGVGAVRFDYGAETVYIAGGVDEPEGREIVTWLARRLPAGALDIG